MQDDTAALDDRDCARTRREVLLAVIDPTNSSFASYFEGVKRPEVDDPAGVHRWLLDLIEDCIASKQSAIVDLGGGDTVLRSLAGELPGFAQEIERGGLSPVIFYLTGNQPEDLLPAVTLKQRGFSPCAQAIVFNETAIATGSTREQTFSHLAASPEFRDMSIVPHLMVIDVVPRHQEPLSDGKFPAWIGRRCLEAARLSVYVMCDD
ncbi:hypothetical protein ACELLULO517_27020 [Acidisoma cellulosilytica]|uniref:Uncharacterized protein n=1 Tax=Acidisoma cellulosilyticum TaxID=2802395 RepID=A0A963Z8R5_9PROT|nr:hypothetical protein [Acidisoma cellulosilyticum]MCB8883928.1 hypothetical protein [Acidisoma cellulosilyticum]